MFRFAMVFALFHASQGVFAAPVADATPAAAPAGAPAMKFVASADPDRLLPPLPPLASLPASAAQDVEEVKGVGEVRDEVPVPHGARRSKKVMHGRAHFARPPEIVVRIVVSPESRAYLMSMSSKLDAVLRGAASDARSAPDAVSVAMTR